MGILKKSVLIFFVFYYLISFILCLNAYDTSKEKIFVIIAYIFAYVSAKAGITGKHWRYNSKFVLFNNISVHKKIYFVIHSILIVAGSYLFFVKKWQVSGVVIGLGCSYVILFLNEKFKSEQKTTDSQM